MNFTAESFFNPHLSIGTNRIDAVLSINANAEAASGAPASGSTTQRAVAFVMDISGSMQGDRLLAAKHAVRCCIDLLDEDTLFAVVSFHNQAKEVVPLRKATKEAKELAHHAVQRLDAGGGTAMSKALLATKLALKGAGKAICYALFLTDGDNNRDDGDALQAALSQCKGVFQCDCRGVGTDWKPHDVRLIAGALLGNADAVANPNQLADDFRSSIARALAKGVGDVRLRLWSPKTAKVVAIKQMSPEIADLLALARPFDDKTLEVPLGAWGTESRDYHITIEVAAGIEGDEMLACRPAIVYAENGGEKKVAGQPVIAAWTGDEGLSTRINAQVAHYTGQTELADSIREGLEAQARGDVDTATRLLGKASKIAIASGNDDVTRRLKKVVDVIDADLGTVRLKSGAGKADILELDMGGTRTVRRRPAAPAPGKP
jgi:hypothetical protein